LSIPRGARYASTWNGGCPGNSGIPGSVWAQVGFGVIEAYKAAGRKLVPMVGESENGFRSAMAGGTVAGISYGSPPYTGAYALKEAVAILQGKPMPRLMQVPLPLNTRPQLKLCTNAAHHLPSMRATGKWRRW
jgi:ABC-type sugar transport system substrate-binding protein